MTNASVEYAVEFRGVSFTYWQAEEPALQDISVQIPAGQFVVVTGPTGAGKSTFLQMLNGLIPHHIPGTLKGDVRIQGASTKDSRVVELSPQVGLVFEDPDAQIVSLTVEDDIAFGPSNLRLAPAEIRDRLRRVLQQTRLEGFENRNPFTLSGGEKQSLAMAGILAMQPGILALDEPTSMLDPIGRRRIVDILKSLAAETNTTILLVEQNPELVIELVDRILVFDGGRIIKDGPPRAVYDDVETLLRVGAKLPPVVEVFWELRKQGLWDGPIPLTPAEAAEALLPRLNENPSYRQAAAQEAAQPGRPERRNGGAPVIDVRSVEHRFDHEVVALKAGSIAFARGQTTAIIGQNGSGKSTLAFHLVGILHPTNPQGQVLVDGLDTARTPLRELIRHINYVFQNPDDQLFQESVAQEIEYGLVKLGIDPEERQRRLEAAAAQFGLEPYLEQSPKSLSRGLRTKTAIASIMAMQPPVLIVDEPTTGLDRRESLEILQVFRQLAQAGTTVIFITHEMDLVAQFADRAVVMHAGTFLSDGEPAHIFAQDDVLRRASLSLPDLYCLSRLLGWPEFSGLRAPADLAGRIALLLQPGNEEVSR